MLPEIQHAVQTARAGQSFSEKEMAAAIGALMDGKAAAAEIADLLSALAEKGETAAELAGAASAMRARATRVPVGVRGLLDTCGTGGDRLNTFNISTATAIVIASAGTPVAKHGNRSATSSSGSAEVLEALGVDINLSPSQVGRCIAEVGIGFCYARLLHSAMKHVAPVRAELPFRTIFNLLGPLTNPAGAEYQLIGASRSATAAILADAVARLGTRRTLVVCGNDQIDEVALWGETEVYDVGERQVRRQLWTAGDVGLPECSVEELRVDSPAASAAVIRDVLAGAEGAARNIVAANAAAAFWCLGKGASPSECARLAEHQIDSGAAAAVLERLRSWSHAAASESRAD